MNSRIKGIVYTILSAIIFGFTPILAKISYANGANSISVTFFRAFLALPVYIIILKRNGINIKLNRGQLKKVLLMAIMGASVTTILLYSSYNFISVGMATSIHFIYPVIVALISVVLYKETMSFQKIIALIWGTVGVIFFMGKGSSNNLIGIFIALVSGFTYAFYIIYMDKSGLQDIHYFKLSFYICLIMSITSAVFGLATNSLSFTLSPKGWVCVFLISMFTSVGAIPLFQLGIKYAGSTVAAILSIAEPITSIVLGILILKEDISLFKIIGCICIIISIIFIAKDAGSAD